MLLDVAQGASSAGLLHLLPMSRQPTFNAKAHSFSSCVAEAFSVTPVAIPLRHSISRFHRVSTRRRGFGFSRTMLMIARLSLEWRGRTEYSSMMPSNKSLATVIFPRSETSGANPSEDVQLLLNPNCTAQRPGSHSCSVVTKQAVP